MRKGEILSEILRRLDRMEVALIVRDPGTALSADAYDGLRKQVAVAARERQAHLAQLALLDEAFNGTDDLEGARRILVEFMQQAGLVRVEDPGRRELYEVVAGDGEGLEILAPAYVEEGTGRLVRQGRARAVEGMDSPDESVAPAEEATHVGESRGGEQPRETSG